MRNTPHFITFDDLTRHLDARGFFRIEPGLERIRQAFGRFGLESPPFYVIQVVGTNGKGSTSTFLESLARAHGLRTGLYTSPHFVSIRERVRVNHAMLDESEWVALGNKAVSSCPDMTYFEFTTAVAALAFQKAKVDIAIMEAGLGGSWDATTAMRADITVFTPIDIDHASVLGNTIRAIAKDKAGAIRPETQIFSARQTPEAEDVLQTAAREKRAPLAVSPGFPALPEAVRKGETRLGIGGAYQGTNAGLALDAWRHAARALHVPEDERSVLRGLADAFIPGRFQNIPAGENMPPLLLDGAHNPHGLAALGRSLAEQGISPGAVIFSCLADKDVETIIAHLRVLSTGPMFVPPIEDNPRAMDPHILARAIGNGATASPSLEEALRLAGAYTRERLAGMADVSKNPVLLCGSLYLLGQFYALHPEYLDPPR